MRGENNPFWGKQHTEEARQKMSIAHRGKKLSIEHRQKLSKAQIGKYTGSKNPMWKKEFSGEHRHKISIANTGKGNGMFGKKHTTKTKEKIRKKRLGKKLSAKTKAKLSQRLRGKGNPRWKNGLTEVAGRIRNSYKYKEWRQSVFVHDNFTCQKCGKRGGDLEVHHIKPFRDLLEEVKEYLPLFDLYDGALLYSPLWEKENGMTLCKNKCHKRYIEKRGV